MNTSARTGSYPLMDLANTYGLPLELVYCYAQRCKVLLLAKDGDMVPNDYWGNRARVELYAIGRTENGFLAMDAMRTIMGIVHRHLLRQGHSFTSTAIRQ